MKRMFSVLLSAALLLSLLPACNRQAGAVPTQPVESEPAAPDASAPSEAEPDCALIVFTMWDALDIEVAEADMLLSNLDEDDIVERLAAYIEGAYGLLAEEWEDGSLIRGTGMSAVELAVLRFADEESAKHGEDCLRDYLHRREGDFSGYAPDQAKLVADAALCREGLYVGLFICEDSGLAQSAFEEIINLPAPKIELPEPTQDVVELLNRLLEMCEIYGNDTSDLERVDSGDPDRLKSIVEEEYGLADYPWMDAAIARGTNGSVFEVAVLHIDGDLHMGMDAVEELNAYLDAKEAAHTRFPAQAELLHNALAAWNNGFIALLVCNESEYVALNLGGSLGYTGSDSGYSTMRRYMEKLPEPSAEPDPVYSDRVKFTPPGKDDMSLYDTSAIRAAWASGDPSGLSEYDRETYDAAQAILGEILTDGMTDLEKETAIYHWLVDNVDYDWRHQDIMAETPRSSYEPHGGLVDYTAVCLGYATSFQLLMDLAGVECITVPGAAFSSTGDHAWNMVRLNGEWYCVDVTWDANAREQTSWAGFDWSEEYWIYFNVTSDEMANEDHQWDYANTPEATTEDHGRG